MKKLLKLSCLALLAISVVGCGKKAQVPEKTIAAAYVDIEKAYANGKDLCEVFIDALPKEMREGAKKEYEGAIKQIDENKKLLNPQWAVAAIGGTFKELANAGGETLAVAVRVSTSEEDFTKLLKDNGFGVEPKKEKDGLVFPLGTMQLGLINGKYLIFGLSENSFKTMFDLYAGNGKASDDFGELARISGNTIARFSTAPISSLLERFELQKEIENFGKITEDEDIADMVLGMGAISLDVKLDDDDIGLIFRVVCDSSGDAKIVDHFFQAITFCARAFFDGAAYAAEKDVSLPIPMLSKSMQKEIAQAKLGLIAAARSIEAERDSNIAQLSFVLDIDDLTKMVKESFK